MARGKVDQPNPLANYFGQYLVKVWIDKLYALTCSEQKGTNMVETLARKGVAVVVTGERFREDLALWRR